LTMMEGYDGGHASLGTLQEAGKEEGQATWTSCLLPLLL
jgi:hypothetical protein